MKTCSRPQTRYLGSENYSGKKIEVFRKGQYKFDSYTGQTLTTPTVDQWWKREKN